MSTVRTIVTGTVVGLSTLWAGIAGTQYLGRKINEAVTEMTKEAVDVTMKEVIVPVAAEAIGYVVKDVGAQVIEEKLKRELGYYMLKDLFERRESMENTEDRETEEVFREIMKQRGEVAKENK